MIRYPGQQTSGVRQMQAYLAADPSRRVSVYQFWQLVRVTCRHLRGWFFGLGFLLTTAYGMVAVLYQAERAGNLLHYAGCGINRVYLPEWLFSQWLFGLGLAIGLSLLVVVSSAALGLAARLLTRRGYTAFMTAVLIRALPVIAGLLSSGTVSHTPEGQLATWESPVLLLADTGLSALFKFAEPGANIIMARLSTVGLGVLAASLALDLLGGYSILSLVLVQRRFKRPVKP